MHDSMTPEDILRLRRAHVGPSLSLSYDEPLTIVRGAGALLFDEAGRDYLDCVNNVAHVGHGHPKVVRAVSEQMAELNTNTRYLHPKLVEYARRLTATLPAPLSVCYLVNSGSEANELALRLARAHTGGTDVIVVDAAYHGNTNACIAMSPYKFAGPGGGGREPWVHVADLPDPYRGRFREDDPRAGAHYGEQVGAIARRIAEEGRTLAAFFAESLPSCGGQIVPPAGYLAAAFDAVRAAGGVCVADEVQVGFGRVGPAFWGFAVQGVIPDIVTLGKPIGNGHPLGAVVTTPAIAASFDNGMEYFNTFGGNPVSCAAGLAVLDIVEGEELPAHALEVGGLLKEGFQRLQAEHPILGDVRGEGLFLGIEVVSDPGTREPDAAAAKRIVEGMKRERILLSMDGPDHDVIKIKPPMVFLSEDAERLLDGLGQVLANL